MGVVIEDIAYHLPEKVLSNEQLAREHPQWDMNRVLRRGGVVERRIAADGETALDLAKVACEKLLAGHEGLRERIDALVFCTQSPDYVLPPNSCLLHGALGLPENVMAFDCNHACSAYVYALAIARSMLLAGTASNVLLVNADTYSKYIHPDDRSARILFGDGAAATWIRRRDDVEGVVDVLCSTFGQDFQSFYLPAGGCRLPKSSETCVPVVDDDGNVRTQEHIHMDGFGILTFVNRKVSAQVHQLLEKHRLSIDDVDLFLFHQASKLALETLARMLDLPQEKVYTNLELIGNTVSASIPIAIKDAMGAGIWRPGQKVVLAGFGVGLSWATALVEL